MDTIILDEPCDNNVLSKFWRIQKDAPHGTAAIISKWAKCAIKGTVKVEYTIPKEGRLKYNTVESKEKKGYSLGMMWGGFRSEMARDRLIDIDIVNCHPSLLAHYFEKNGIPYPKLKIYNEKRNEVLSIKGNRYKYDVIAYINGGSLKPEDEDMRDFYEEIKQNMLNIIDPEKILKHKEFRRRCGIFSQSLEREALLELYKFCQTKKVKVATLIFDGLMIYKPLPNNFINDLNGHLNHIYNNHVQVIEKPLEFSGLFDQVIDSLQADNESELVDMFFDKYKDKLYVYDHNIYIKMGNLLINDSGPIIELIMRTDMQVSSGLCIKYNYGKAAREFLKTLKSFAYSKNMGSIDSLIEQSIGKIYFKNGYYSFTDGKFVESEESTLIRIEEDYQIDSYNFSFEHPYVEELYVKVFNIFSDSILETVLRSYARAISGHYLDKLWYIVTGERNSGKGLFNHLLETTFGKYVVSIPPPIAGSFGESAQAYRWVITTGCYMARIAYSNESVTRKQFKTKKDCPDVVLDGNAIKNLVSAGDKITARKLNENETSVVNKATLFLNFNKVPPSDPPDVVQTCRVIPMPYKFTDDPDPNHDEKLACPEIKNIISSSPYLKHAFMWVLQQYYGPVIQDQDIPNCMTEYKTEVICDGEPCDFKGVFQKYFEKKEGAYTHQAYANAIFAKRLNMSTKAVALKLKKLGFEVIQKKIDGINKKVYKDLLLKPMEEPNLDETCELD